VGDGLFDVYRRQWPRIGAVIALALGGLITLASGRLSKTRLLSALNLLALLAHQYEEYVDPGYFPGQFNRGLFKSDSPRNYPLNPQTAMVINTALAYPFYIGPVVFRRPKWLSLAAVLLGWSQAVLHGIVLPRRSGASYGPGFLTALLLHVPIGIAYVKALNEEDPISARDWASGLGCAVASTVGGLVLPNLAMRDKNSPYEFTAAQMGPYDVAPTAAIGASK
jgi:hypothetical protein